jgi:hypothetical protein
VLKPLTERRSGHTIPAPEPSQSANEHQHLSDLPAEQDQGQALDPIQFPEFVGVFPRFTENGTFWHYVARFQGTLIADLYVYQSFTETSRIQRDTHRGSLDERCDKRCGSVLCDYSGHHCREAFTERIARGSFEGRIIVRREASCARPLFELGSFGRFRSTVPPLGSFVGFRVLVTSRHIRYRFTLASFGSLVEDVTNLRIPFILTLGSFAQFRLPVKTWWRPATRRFLSPLHASGQLSVQTANSVGMNTRRRFLL